MTFSNVRLYVLLCKVLKPIAVGSKEILKCFRASLMGATDITKYLNDDDQNGQKIGDWASQVQKGKFVCKVCDPDKPLSFKSGKCELLKHSTTEKHIKKTKDAKSDTTHQASIKDLFQKPEKDNEIDMKVLDFEAKFVMVGVSHGIPTAVMDCLTETLQDHITDSEIIKKMKLKEKKAAYIANHGLAEVFENETVEKLKKCFAFSISLDESEVNKQSQLEIIVNIANKDGIETGIHYNTLPLEGGDAETIKNTILDQLQDDGIDYKSKLIDVSTDGCNTMVGIRNGFQKKMAEEVPCLHYTGHCRCHDFSNTMQHGTQEFCPDLTLALVDVYQAFGGEKGTGSSKMRKFQESCRSRGHDPKPFKKFVTVRFRSIRTCIEPVLFNFDELVHFMKNIQSKTKKPSDRETRLIEMFVNREVKTKLSLLFINAATMELSNKIDFFEQNRINVANVFEVMGGVLIEQMEKVFDENELNILDPVSEEVRKKSPAELVLMDVTSAKRLGRKEIFIGSEASKFIKSIGLSVSSSQLDWFFDRATKCHITFVKYLIKYLSSPLTSTIMDSLTALGQRKQSHCLTKGKLKHLVGKYYKVVTNIDPTDGMDMIEKEIRTYVTDEDIKTFEENLDFEEYWSQVSKITVGDGWKKYEILPHFAMAMGTKFNSNSEVERSFSIMNYIHQNKHRNCLSQDSLNNILHIKSAVDSKHNKQNCTTCISKVSTSHCHCSLVVMTQPLRQSCKKARAKYFQSLDVARETKELMSDGMKEKKKKVDQELKEKFEKLKEKVEKGGKIFKPDQMESVYKKKKPEAEGVSDKNKKAKDMNDNNTNTSAVKRKGAIPTNAVIKKHRKK